MFSQHTSRDSSKTSRNGKFMWCSSRKVPKMSVTDTCQLSGTVQGTGYLAIVITLFGESAMPGQLHLLRS